MDLQAENISYHLGVKP